VGYFASRSPPFDHPLEGSVRAVARLEARSSRSESPMTLLLAAVGATVMALMELTVGPYLRIGDAQPHLLLVVGIVVTVAVGFEAGLVWAFVGGLALDAIAQRPLGSTAFALLLSVGATAVIAHVFARLRPIVPILATILVSLAYSMILFLAFNALRAPIPVASPVDLVVPSAIYDIVLAALIGPLAISIHDRRAGESERVDW
jgi:rod shape-determining protein MreD